MSPGFLLCVENHFVYSGKLRLSVVDLAHIDLATEENQHWHIDKWAALFKTTTWEEIKMIAQRDDSILSAANTIWKLTRRRKSASNARPGRITVSGSWMYNTRLIH